VDARAGVAGQQAVAEAVTPAAQAAGMPPSSMLAHDSPAGLTGLGDTHHGPFGQNMIVGHCL